MEKLITRNHANHQFVFITMVWILLAGLILPAHAQEKKEEDAEAQFKSLAQKVRAGESTSSQALKLMKQAREQGRAFLANEAIKGYLRKNLSPDANVIRNAAETVTLAGDLRLAVSRYKNFLRASPANETASRAAARMYELMIEYLHSPGDAYQYMVNHAADYRQSTEARKYDQWFVHRAIGKHQYTVAIKHLNRVLSDANKLEKKTWTGTIVRLINSMLRDLPDSPDQALKGVNSLSRVAKHATTLRGQRKYCLLGAAYLQFRARARDAQGEEKIKELFEPVAAQARQWIEADPTPTSVSDILNVFAGPNHNDRRMRDIKDVMSTFTELKKPVLQYAFEKLGKQREWLLDNELTAPYIEWKSHIRDYPALSNRLDWNEAAAPLTELDKKELNQYAKAVKGTGSAQDKILQALTGNDHPMEAARQVWKHSNSRNADRHVAVDRLPAILGHYYGDAFDRAQYYKTYWNERVAPFPAAVYYHQLAQQAAKKLFTEFWKQPDTLAKLYHRMDWVPWPEHVRRRVLRNDISSMVRDQDRTLRNTIRDLSANRNTDLDKEARKAKIEELKKQRKKLDTIQKLIATLSDPEKLQDAKAPNPVAAGMNTVRQLHEKIQDSSEEEKKEKLRNKLHTVIGDTYDKLLDLPPAEAQLQRWSMIRRLARYADQDARIRMLKNECRLTKEKDFGAPHAILWVQQRHDRHWPDRLGGEHYHKLAARYNRILRKHIAWQIDNGRSLNKTMLNWLVHTKNGHDWKEPTWAQQVMQKLIEKRLLFKQNLHLFDNHSITVNYMMLLQDDFFPQLKDEYPPASYFDDWLVKEARDTGTRLDRAYWKYGGKDEEGTICAWVLKQWQQERNPVGEAWRWRDHFLNSGGHDKMIAYIKENSLSRLAGGWNKLASYGRVHEDAKARKNFFADLRSYMDFARQHPLRYRAPSLRPLENVKPDSLSDKEVDTLYRAVTSHLTLNGHWDYRHHRPHHAPVIDLLNTALRSSEQTTRWLRVAPVFWKLSSEYDHGGRRRDQWNTFAKWTRNLANANSHNMAAAFATAGLEIIGTRLPEEARSEITSVRARSYAHVGGIPVPKDNPRYELYQAQLAYQAGNVQKAWEKYRQHSKLLQKTYKDLNLDFLTWLVKRHTQFKEFDKAEELARLFIRFVDSGQVHFQPAKRGKLFLAYANIALSRKEYPRARAQYERIAANEAYQGTRIAKQAQIRIAEIDRITRNYSQAIDRLKELSESEDPYLRVNSLHQLARLKYDREAYEEAGEYLEKVLMISPDHAESQLLKGKLNLKLENLEEATQVDIGLTRAQKIIVPGKPLQIKLEDRNLSIVGHNTNIEIHVWTEHGDEERFNLYPFGNSRTRFQGSITTKLAPVDKGDGTLQLLGDDIVHYDFSDAFKKKANITSTHTVTLNVATEASLQASATEILTQEQLEERRLRMEMAEGRVERAEAREALRATELSSQVRPGNPLHVRVTDPDRSVTEKKDNINVRISTTSGDHIKNATLAESGGTSGQFNGSVETAPAPPSAAASDSQEGLNPNFAISPNDDHPAWTGALDNQTPKFYSVDMNDNVTLDTLKVQTVPDRNLKSFFIQTAYKPGAWQTVGSWPHELKRWDGGLQLEVMPRSEDQDFEKLDELIAKLDWGWRLKGSKRKVKQKNKFATELKERRFVHTDLKGLVGRNGPFVARLRGAFYIDELQRRLIRLNMSDLPQGWMVRLRIDENTVKTDQRRRRNNGDKSSSLTMRLDLEKGVHLAEVIIIGRSNHDCRFKLMTDTDEPPYEKLFPVELFNQKQHPRIAKKYAFNPAEITEMEKQAGFQVDFPEETNTRLFRLVMLDFKADAPGLKKLELTNAEGEQVLPTEDDFAKLRKNDTLEIIPGDKITVEYNDPKTLQQGSAKLAEFLDVTYHNAEVNASFVQYHRNKDGERVPEYIEMVRFKTGEPAVFEIDDPDMDRTGEQNTVPFQVWKTGGKPQKMKALETGEHTGIFRGRVFPVEEKPDKAKEKESAREKATIEVAKGDQLFFSYLDKENTDPGIPWKRQTSVQQVFWQDPQLRIFKSTVQPVQTETESGETEQKPKPALLLQRPDMPQADAKRDAYIDGPKVIELTFPTITLSPQSTATIYAQTERARQKAAKRETGRKKSAKGTRGPDKKTPAEKSAGKTPYDITVPGTIKLTQSPSDGIPGESAAFSKVLVNGIPDYRKDPVYEGVYTFNLPTELGDVPKESLATGSAGLPRDREAGPKLKIQGDAKVHIGFKYTDKQGNPQWITRTINLKADPRFDTYDQEYEETVDSMYVGETLYLQVTDKAKDLTPKRDEIKVRLTTESGDKAVRTLRETFEHTGVFRGLITPVFAAKDQDQQGEQNDTDGEQPEQNKTETPEKEQTPNKDQPRSSLPSGGSAAQEKLYVEYGDRITAVYEGPEKTLKRKIKVNKGADGDVLIFTKKFEDDEIAMQTQFRLAEAYFELAKKHRQLGQKQVAEEEIKEGKKLLQEAIRDFPDARETRAQAEYLLANLALESGKEAEKKDKKQDYFNEAVTRFNDIVATYPKSSYAPKAQYKKALTYEKMGKIDKASEEYVKLSYRYPDHKLVAETIARLGRYFWTKGKQAKDEAKQAAEQVKKYKLQKKSNEMYKTAGEVFARLGKRFPNHDLAGKTAVLSGQAFIQAGEYATATKTFQEAMDQYEGDKQIAPRAMYWCGTAYMRMPKEQYEGENDPMIEAYKMYKNLTWDYPASKWAKYARGQLTTKKMQQAASRANEE